jgi:hypothetical protein
VDHVGGLGPDGHRHAGGQVQLVGRIDVLDRPVFVVVLEVPPPLMADDVHGDGGFR